MTDHYSPMAITQLVHSNEDHSAAETLHCLTNSSSSTSTTMTTANGDYRNKHNITSPALSMYSTSTTSPRLTSSSSSFLSDPPRNSSSTDASSCLGKSSFSPTFLSTAAATQNESNRTESYGKRMCASSANNQDSEDKETIAATHALARTSLADEPDDEGQHICRRVNRMDNEDTRKPPSRPHSRSTSPHRPYVKSISSTGTRYYPAQARYSQSKPNQTRWQQLVIQAGSAAGTTAAVVSEESMKCLRYCLHWLQYATQHIQQQMQFLRFFLVSLATSSSTTTTTTTTTIHTVSQSNQQPPPSLSSIQHEIILTLRKVVEVVSRYSGVGLPTHAKASVRSFILQLPGRWASLNTNNYNNNSNDRPGPNDDDVDSSVSDHVKETSIKLLNFGGESIEMLDSVSSVFSYSIDRAELWLDRLRLVGVVPSTQSNALES